MCPSEKEQRSMEQEMRRKTPKEIAKIEKVRVHRSARAEDVREIVQKMSKDHLLEVIDIAHNEGVRRGYGTYWSE